MIISNIIQEILEERGMTIKDLSKLMDMPYTTLFGIMKRGLAKADVQIFIDICKALGEKPEDIIKLVYDDSYYQSYQEEKLIKTLKEFGMPEDILETMDEDKKKKFIQALKALMKQKK
ncbi:MAG TPA: helix-turn-helix transcriptional regulator [Clostridia bacterium]